jgi:outer membrane receptor protein involved in Fe transport
MRSRGMAFVGPLLCLLVLAVPALAQEQSGAIHGVVKDSSGAVLPGVTVEARSSFTSRAVTVVTDARGAYRFPALPPGDYEVTATLEGFATGKVSRRSIALGELLTVDFTLSVAKITESVVVTGATPLIDTKQNASFATIQQDIMDRIPKGRDFTSVVSVAPGTNNESYAGGIQIDGASGSENRFIIDGMDTTNMRSGTSSKTVLYDFLQEVQVKSSGYNAEFGGATGGVINVLTKSGSNVYKGSVGTYYNGNFLRGPVRAGWRINPWTDRGGSFPGELEQVKGRDNDRWNRINPVVDLGGPVFRDQLWFYMGFSQNRNDYSRTVKYMYSNPVGAQRTFTWFDQQRYLNWNLSTQLTNAMRFKASGGHQWNTSRRGTPSFQSEGSTFSGLTGTSAVLNGQSTSGGWTSATYYPTEQQFKDNYELTGSDYINHTFSGNLDWILSPTFFVNMTAGTLIYNTTQPPNFATQSARVTYGASNTSYLPGVIPDDLRHASGWANIDKSNSLTARSYYQRLFANLNTIWYASFAGQHTFKFGARFERVNNEMNDGYQFPVFNIYWNSSYTNPSGVTDRGTYGYYRVRQTSVNGKANSNNWAFWLQDSWTVKKNLTINAGIRTENEQVPSYSAGAGIKFGFLDKMAPRVGFAWDVKGNGRWKAYGSYGWFFDVMKLSLPISSFGGDRWIDYFFALDTYDWSQIACNPAGTGGFVGTCGPGRSLGSYDYRFNSSIVDPRLTAFFKGQPHNTIDPNLKPYQTRELTFGLDHELNPSTSIGIRYVHKTLKYTIEDVGVLIPDPAIEVYFIANPGYGVSEIMLPDFPDRKTPPAKRDYDSVELRLKKRLSRSFSLNTSYLWSRLYGNYSGLASSDESGRTDPNVSRYFDAPYMSWNAQGQPTLGPLYTDRPHQFKIQSTYDFPFGTSVGVIGSLQSGMPVGLLASWQGYPVFVSTRDSLGRTPFVQRYDMQILQTISFKGNHKINMSVNIDNLFDFKTVLDYNQTINRNSFTYDDTTFFAGWDPFQLMTRALSEGKNMRYNPLVSQDGKTVSTKPYSYMGRREFRFNIKYAF